MWLAGSNVAPFLNPTGFLYTQQPQPRGAGSPTTGVASTLLVLPELGSTDLHLVADDYTSGDWVSRVGGFTATLSGTVTKQSSSQFTGRSELTGFSTSNAFSLATNAAHTYTSSQALTYEIVAKNTFAGASYTALGFTAATQGHYIQPNNVVSLTNVARVINNAAGNYQLVSAGAVNPQSAKYTMITVVFDPVTPIIRYAVNGNSTAQTSATVTGTLDTTAHGLGIGALWNGSVFTSPWNGPIVEIIRHRVALTTTEITQRVALFNNLKGY